MAKFHPWRVAGVSAWFVLWVLGVAAAPAHAQRTASMAGTVVDQSGAVLPGVTVTVSNMDTNISRTVVADTAGRYSVPVLEPGRYRAVAEFPGFRPVEILGITLAVGGTVTQDFTLAISDVTERVTVSAAPPTIDTSSSSVKALVTAEQIESLPLNGRNFTELALLQPGVTKNHKGRSHVQALGRGPQITISGARPTGSIFMLDGTIINNKESAGAYGLSGNQLGADAIREFQVQVNTFSAEYSRATGGVMNIVTKSGTNDVHGSIFGYHRNDSLNSRDFFDISKPSFKRYQFGATAGGPIRRDSTFFFVNYEGLREDLGQTFRSVVPTAQARQGILPGRPAFQVNPGVLEIVETIFPLPNTGLEFGNGTGEFAFSAPLELREDFVTARLDHQFSSSDLFFTRYTLNDSFRRAPNFLPAFADTDSSRAQWLTAEYNRIVSPRIVNTLRAGWARSFTDASIEVPDVTYIEGRPLGRLDSGEISHPGMDQTPLIDTLDHLELQNNIGIQAGRHQLQVGVHVQNEHYDTSAASRLGGRVTFGSLESYLKGTPDLVEAMTFDSDIDRQMTQWIFGAYVQDTVRARSNLTLNLGLRYEPATKPREKNGEIANLVNLTDPTTTVGASWRRNPTLKNFSPRVGVNWDPFSDGKTVLQAGVGVYYDLIINKAVATWTRRVPPFFNVQELRGTALAGLPFPGMPASAFLAPKTPPVTAVSYDIDQPTIMQWNTTAQRQIANTTVTLGYMGSRGANLLVGAELNVPTPIMVDGEKFFPPGSQNNKLNPLVGSMGIERTIGSSNYHALQVSSRSRAGGLNVQTSYTLSSNIDTGSITSAVQAYNEPQALYDPHDPERDRGFAAFHSRHNFVGNFSYQLPSFGDSLAANIFGGWGLSGILSISSGSPFTVGYNSDRNRDGVSSERPDLVAGASDNPVDPGNVLQYFDIAAFQFQPLGYFGNLGRNTLIGPGVVTFDLGLLKKASLFGTANLEFRAEVFNLLNRANFQVPGAGISTGVLRIFNSRGEPISAATRINATSTGPRQSQLSLRLRF